MCYCGFFGVYFEMSFIYFILYFFYGCNSRELCVDAHLDGEEYNNNNSQLSPVRERFLSFRYLIERRIECSLTWS